MANAYKVLGQAAPGASTATDLYTVPSSTEAVARVRVTNRGSGATTFDVQVRDGGATAANKHYVASGQAIDANSSVEMTGIALSATDVVTVEAASANVSFTCDGVEIT